MIGSDTGPGRVPCRDLPKTPIRFSSFPPNLATFLQSPLPRIPQPNPLLRQKCAAAAASAGRRPAKGIARVNQLERALEEDSKRQVSTLKSEVATLVRALGDIKKPMSRPDATPPRATRSGMRTVWPRPWASVIGLGFGILAWVYLTADADTTIAAPAPVSTQGLVADPPPAVRGPTVSEGPKTSAPEWAAHSKHPRHLRHLRHLDTSVICQSMRPAWRPGVPRPSEEQASRRCASRIFAPVHI